VGLVGLGLGYGLGYGFVLRLVYGYGIWFVLVLVLGLAFYENIPNTSHIITIYHYWTRYCSISAGVIKLLNGPVCFCGLFLVSRITTPILL